MCKDAKVEVNLGERSCALISPTDSSGDHSI
jgi:hypothetical protein